MAILTENRKARFDYEILETFEAGIVLTGQEVKSIRTGKANLTGSYVIIKSGAAQLLGAQIPPYQPLNTLKEYDPTRTRKLLLHNDEINLLLGKTKEHKLTLIPLSMYSKGRKIKISIGLAKHKKQHDKREAIKKRETSREMRRALKS